MAFNTQLNPTLVALSQPTKKSALSFIGEGLTQYDKQTKDNEVRELNMADMRSKVSDDRLLAKYKTHLDEGGNKRTFAKEGNVFMTAGGAMGAESLDKGRAMQRIQEGRYGLAVKRANAPKRSMRKRTKKTKPSGGSVPTSGLDGLNSLLQGQTLPSPQASPTSTTRTVYIGGKPVTIQVEG